MPDEATTPQSSVRDQAREPFGTVVRVLSLSRVQSVVAILAGGATVLGAAMSLAQVGRPTRTGTLVAVVRAASAARDVTDSTVEVLTADNALVATLTPDADGRVTQALREGVYVVRVSEPHCSADVHRVDVQAGHTVEIKATLRPASSPSADRTISRGVSAVRRALGIR